MKLQCVAASAVMFTAILTGVARADMWITEWAYSAGSGEYVEFTNVGTSAVDLTGWSFDDSSEIPGSFSLSPLGTVVPGESVIITEAVEADFRAAWSLPASVKVLGDNINNLGRGDEINLYDDSDALVDRLTYGDQDFPGSIRTQNAGGNPITPAALGANDPYQWQLSYVGDPFGSYLSSFGDIGNPGTYVVPEPTALLLFVVGGLSLSIARAKSLARYRAA